MTAFLIPSLLAVTALVAQPRAADARSAISVQPFAGQKSDLLRRQVAGLLRKRGLTVVTSIPRVDDPAQYPPIAREHQVSAFVTGDVSTNGRARARARQTVTFTVWNGATGLKLGKWSATAPPRRLPGVVAHGVLKNLGDALQA